MIFIKFVSSTICILNGQSEIDEKKLIQLLADGSEVAFEILFYRYRGKVANFIKRALPPHVDLEETVHEIFLRVWSNKEKLDGDRPFEPYLFRIARNLVVDELRKKIEHAVYLQDGAFEADLVTSNADSEIEENELQNWFKSILDKLPPKRREIFILNRFEELSYREIAAKLNISENTVDTQIRRTLQYFRSELKKLKALLFFL